MAVRPEFRSAVGRCLQWKAKSYSSAVVLLLITICLKQGTTQDICQRLFMQGLDKEATIPWLQMAGIYERQDFTHGGYPIYKHEFVDVYFFYNGTTRDLRFQDGLNANGGALLGAYTNGYSPINRSYRPYYPYGSMITSWYRYDPFQQAYIALSKSTIQPSCVADDFVTCRSNSVEFNEDIRQVGRDNIIRDISIRGVYYYKQLPGVYANQRPVYSLMIGDTASTEPTYLHHHSSGLWLVGDNYSSDEAYLYVGEDASRPEYITSSWKFYSSNKWNSITAKLQCKIFQTNETCLGNFSLMCLNGGQCVNGQGSAVCRCSTGYRGLHCEEAVQSCADPKDLISDLDGVVGAHHIYYVNSFYEGSIMTVFCPKGFLPSYWFSTCQGTGTLRWSITNSCLPPATTTSRPSTTRPSTTTTSPTTTKYYDYYRGPRRFVFENSTYWLVVLVVILAIFMQLCNPVLLYAIKLGISYKESEKIENEDKTEIQALRRELQNKLSDFMQRHPEPDDEYDDATRMELQTIYHENQTSLKEIENKQKDRKNKDISKARFCRILSFYSYITFWVWMLYLILYQRTWLFGGNLFAALYILSILFIILLYLLILLEYRLSSERGYMLNLSSAVSAVDKIESIRATQPTITMTAEAYHYETRTRTVFYLDANGNSQSRIETYQEKVVTAIIVDHFYYRFWKDVSDSKVMDIRKKGITKIKMELRVEPGDDQTASEIETQYEAFKQAHRFRDVFVDFNTARTVDGFEKRLAAYTDSRTKPWWISCNLYLVATFLGLGWPYRCMFNSATGRTEYTVKKVVYSNYPLEDTNVNGLQTYITTEYNNGSPVGVASIDSAVSAKGGQEQVEVTQISVLPPPYSAVVEMATVNPAFEVQSNPIGVGPHDNGLSRESVHVTIPLRDDTHLRMAAY